MKEQRETRGLGVGLTNKDVIKEDKVMYAQHKRWRGCGCGSCDFNCSGVIVVKITTKIKDNISKEGRLSCKKISWVHTHRHLAQSHQSILVIKGIFITFTHNCTRKTWVYFLKEKSKALDVFKALVEKTTILCIRPCSQIEEESTRQLHSQALVRNKNQDIIHNIVLTSTKWCH